MLRKMLTGVRTIARNMGFDVIRIDSAVEAFHSNHYLRHNARRLEHLASLRISVAGMSVLEVGAGIGDHSNYYIDRGCKMTITEARPESLNYLKARYPKCDIHLLDMEHASHVNGAPFDVVHCYGLLYHLSDPKQALVFLSQHTRKMMFLETRVSFGENEDINLIGERQADPTQACSGTGCRPTRVWLFKTLQEIYEYVYIPTTQPNHEEFPIDWNAPEKHASKLKRAIFIASRERLENDKLVPYLIPNQTRHE